MVKIVLLVVALMVGSISAQGYGHHEHHEHYEPHYEHHEPHYEHHEPAESYQNYNLHVGHQIPIKIPVIHHYDSHHEEPHHHFEHHY